MLGPVSARFRFSRLVPAAMRQLPNPIPPAATRCRLDLLRPVFFICRLTLNPLGPSRRPYYTLSAAAEGFHSHLHCVIYRDACFVRSARCRRTGRTQGRLPTARCLLTFSLNTFIVSPETTNSRNYKKLRQIFSDTYSVVLI
jgi:hypothetical protein